MKFKRILSLLLCAVTVFSLVPSFINTAAEESNPASGTNGALLGASVGATAMSELASADISWVVSDLNISYENNRIWDADTLTWSDAYDYDCIGSVAEFTVENHSKNTVTIKLGFTPSTEMTGIATAHLSYGDDDTALTSGGIDIASGDGQTLKSIVEINTECAEFKALTDTETPRLLGTYTFTLEAEVPQSDYLTARFIDSMVDGTIPVFAEPNYGYSVGSLIDMVIDNGDGTYKFPKRRSTDIDYANVSDFNHLTDHITRTLRLARYYNMTDTTAAEKAEVLPIILGLIKYWAVNDSTFQSSNWWYNEINTPNILGEIALLMRDEIPQDLMALVLPIIADGCLTINTDAQSETGANAVWFIYSTLKYGVLTNDTAIINYAISKLKSALGFTNGEGIRQDGSFMQHGARLYNGGYGTALIKNTASILYWLSGSDYQLKAGELQALSTMILDGLRYMSIGNVVDPQSVGRDVSRENGTSISGVANYLLKLLLIDEFPNKDDIYRYMMSINNNTRQNLGMKYFDNAKLITINNSDFYFMYRGLDSNLYYGESLNDENLLFYNTSYGTTTTIVGTTVSDYNKLYQVMDFSYIPGTTAVHEDDSQLLSYIGDDYNKRTLSGRFGGQKYANNAAVSFARTTHEKISFNVACFATNKSAIILGTGLKSSNASDVLYTTLQQEIANGSYTQNGNTVIHNGVKYTNKWSGTLIPSIETLTGSWSRNRSDGSTSSTSASVFTLKIQPTLNDTKEWGAYAYSVMSVNTNEDYEVIKNNTSAQAVKMPDGSIITVFYTNGYSFEYEGKTYTGTIGNSYYYPAN